MSIDHRDPEPLYQQLAGILRARIKAGEWNEDTPLPSESYLVQQYGLSRVTVRKAIEVLRQEGLVITLPQRGTFVTERRPD